MLKREAGFTLVEMSISAAILVIAVAVSMAGLLHALQSYNQADAQDELDTDVQISMERLKSDIRLSAVDKMSFYPLGPGPYTAISFPMAHPLPGQLQVPTNSQGFIIWDQTVIYHVKTGTPYQLRMTVFDPRDNDLTAVERQEQLDSVVMYGDGSHTHNAANANTRVLFENLFQWTISPQGSVYDGYGTEPGRDITVDLGVCIMNTGTNRLTFSVIGKNPNSGGYYVGLDTILATPSDAREAEDYLPPYQTLGPAPFNEYMPAGSWSANYQLLFPATVTGQEFTVVVYNDQWTETNFRRTGYSAERTDISFDVTLDPKDYVVSLIGYGLNWSASAQSGDATGVTTPSNALSKCAVRTLLRGNLMSGGGWISFDGATVAVNFRSGQNLSIEKAYIAECSDPLALSMNTVGAAVPITFDGGSDGAYMAGGSNKWSDYVGMEIDEDKSYLISFLVEDDSTKGSAWRWNEARTNILGCCIITNAIEADLTDPAWDARADVVRANGVLGIQCIATTYPTNGFYTSGPFDTQMDAPVYESIDWDADITDDGSVSMKVRTASDAAMSDAPAWTNISPIASPGFLAVAPKRFVQWQAEIRPEHTLTYSPRLRDVTIVWPGEQRLASIGGVFSKGTNYGTYAVTINGDPLVAGVIIDLEIFADINGYGTSKRITSRLLTEVHPRNTAK